MHQFCSPKEYNILGIILAWVSGIGNREGPIFEEQRSGGGFFLLLTERTRGANPQLDGLLIIRDKPRETRQIIRRPYASDLQNEPENMPQD
jgi:hypothetical protein